MKLANLVFNKDAGTGGLFEIIDFGTSKILKPGETCRLKGATAFCMPLFMKSKKGKKLIIKWHKELSQ